MKTIFLASGFILLFLTYGCMTTFDIKEETGSSLYAHDSNKLIDQDADSGNADGDEEADACPEDPNKTNPGECGCGVPEGACDVLVDTKIDDLCVPNPCAHGVCIEGVNVYSCQCEKGWTGVNCYQNIDDCDPDPCVHGNCVDGIEDYSCYCENGWTGAECDQPVDNCDLAPCLNGTCLDVAGGYSCQCESGWAGAHCDQGIDDCKPDPCVNGSCVDGHNSYTCHCDPGWTGENCENNIDNCPNDPHKTEPGECGCGESDEDSDNDGTPDCDDRCPHDSGKTNPGECGCGTPEGECDIVEVNSNLQVNLGGQWRGVCCRGGEVEVSNDHCRWEESVRVLKTTDLQFGNYTELDCPENGQNPADCACRVPGESLHGVQADGNRNLKNSLRLAGGGPIYPNSGWETCIDEVNAEVRSRWTTGDCPNWRLVDHY